MLSSGGACSATTTGSPVAMVPIARSLSMRSIAGVSHNGFPAESLRLVFTTTKWQGPASKV
jgi:hypothetical protein